MSRILVRIAPVALVASLSTLTACSDSSTTETPVDDGAVDTSSTDDTAPDDTAIADTDIALDDTAVDDGAETATSDTSTSDTSVDDTATADSESPIDSEASPDAVADSTNDTAADATGDTADTAPTSACSSVSIVTAGYVDTHVRQGAGAIDFKVTGSGLSGVTAAKLGAVTCTTSAVTADSVTVSCVIPHAAVLGVTNLELTGGPTCTAAVTIDKITVATTGDDAAVGTATHPFKSVTKGLSVAATNDTVSIASGTYSPTTTGEKWPTTPSSGLPPTGGVPNGVNVEGDPAGGTILAGRTGYSYNYVARGGTFKDLTIDLMDWGFVATNAVTATNVSVRNSLSAGVVSLDTLTMSSTRAGGCVISQNLIGVQAGVAGAGGAADNGTITLSNCDVVSNRRAGALIIEKSKLTTTDVRFQKNGVAGSAAFPVSGSVTSTIGVGVIVAGGGSLAMTGGEVTDSYGAGIVAALVNAADVGKGGNIDVTLTGVDVRRNGGAGIFGQNYTAASGGPTTTTTLTMMGGATDKVADNAAGILLERNTAATITNVTITGNAGVGINCNGSLSAACKLVGVTAVANTQEEIAGLVDITGGSSGPSVLSRGALAKSTTIALLQTRGASSVEQATLFEGATVALSTITGPATSIVAGQLRYQVMTGSTLTVH